MKTHLAFIGRRSDRLRPPPPDIARALARVRNTSGVLAVAFGPHVAGAPHRRAVLQRTLALAELAAGPISAHVDDAVVITSERRKCALAVVFGHTVGKSARRLLRQIEQERPLSKPQRGRAPAREVAQEQARAARQAAREQARAARAAREARQSSLPPSAGSHLLALIQGRGLSVKAAAQRIGASSVSIYYWSRGHHLPRADKLARLAEVLQVEPATLREVLSLDAARAAP